MPLVPTAQIVDEAAAACRGVGAFNVISLEHAEAFVRGAEQADLPVILQISQNTVRWHGRLTPLAVATLEVARAAEVDAAVHLDHATERPLIAEAVRLGVPSVMFDGSTLDWHDNVATTVAVTHDLHARGVWVEAELGEVGGKDGVHAPGVRTDPDEAREFVATTAVDALAVAVGSSHAMTDRTAQLDLERVAQLRAAVSVPLVLHGSSGVPDEQLRDGVRAGLTKINLATHLNAVMTRRIRQALADDADLVDPRRYLGPARDAVADEAARLLELFAT